jgi:two-component system alkaline phosphatase synthesis response regulator PhoP
MAGQLILIADDSRTIVAMVASRLERAGYEVLTTANGEDALNLAKDRVPALILLDVEMPKLDGYEVTRQLRENDATSATPIVLLTSHSDEASLATGYEAGATEYVTKPFSPQDLVSAIERILGRR